MWMCLQLTCRWFYLCRWEVSLFASLWTSHFSRILASFLTFCPLFRMPFLPAPSLAVSEMYIAKILGWLEVHRSDKQHILSTWEKVEHASGFLAICHSRSLNWCHQARGSSWFELFAWLRLTTLRALGDLDLWHFLASRAVLGIRRRAG